jgi:L,D-transpeptidase YcbB
MIMKMPFAMRFNPTAAAERCRRNPMLLGAALFLLSSTFIAVAPSSAAELGTAPPISTPTPHAAVPTSPPGAPAAMGTAPPASPTPGAAVSGSHPGAAAQPTQPELQTLVHAGRLDDLRWPNFPDYQGQVASFYNAGDYSFAWTISGHPTPQATAMIEFFKEANTAGLDPEAYDTSRWTERLAKLAPAAPPPMPADLVHFDLAMTVCAMRYLSDLRIGRVNPHHARFGVDIGGKSYDLADFLRTQIVPAADLPTVMAEVEPPYAGYSRAETALAAYEKLAAQGDGPPLPIPPKSIRPGDSYPAVPQLAARLGQLGDLPPGTVVVAGETRYDGGVVAGVKHFQQRHGLDPDGIVGKSTIVDLNTPLSHRVQQLQYTLERYRWIPPAFAQPPIIVNLPEFMLRTMRRQPAPFLTMRVVVGKAYRKQTPVFAGNMQYVIFRPYWDVPTSIQQAEMVPKLRHDRSYLATHNFEVVDGEDVVTDGTVSDDVFDELREGRLGIRQRPGPKNSLGLVKFIFPNAYNVYLHSTPEPELFARARRDFSHGCIRVQDPLALAAWVLRDDPDWNAQKIATAMNDDKTVRVILHKPIPVLIIYSTAEVEPDGEVRFFDDIYHYDMALRKALARGYPYLEASRPESGVINNPAHTATENPY